MLFETYYRILKHNKKGELVKDSGLLPSHSYVIQFLEFVESLFKAASKTATDVDGAESVLTTATININMFGRADAAVGDDTYGIVVGTNAGVSAEDNEDYALDTKIAHSGDGTADTLNYQAVTFVDARVIGDNVDLDVSRAFLNEHPTESITVKEIGIICKNIQNTKYHLLLRDVVADEAVAAGFTLTVVYTLRTTV